mmetsp:Transcript_11405/g.19427  ORF Transcript_11405/g.19427 Transcript_11405/m.19427 type:complete len:85 (-) Transcript_11405:7-261(-)
MKAWTSWTTKHFILNDVYDYVYFEDHDEATDEWILNCEIATSENCAIIMAEINSLEKCVSETTALFKCRDSGRDSTPIKGCNKC